MVHTRFSALLAGFMYLLGVLIDSVDCLCPFRLARGWFCFHDTQFGTDLVR